MRFFRRLLADRLSGGLVAAIVVYTLLFQGLVIAAAHGAMAYGAPAPDFVLCSQHLAPTGKGDGERDRLPIGADRSCCNALCQAACAVGAALVPDHPFFDAPSMAQVRLAVSGAITPSRPASLGLVAEARGPPPFSSDLLASPAARQRASRHAHWRNDMHMLSKVLAAALVAVAAPAFAADYTVGKIEIDAPWTRATPPSATAGGGFLKITNTGEEDDRLVSAASPIAGRVELHTMDMSGGVMKMREMEDGIPVPAGETVELKPGSLHVMFIDMKGPIAEGAPVAVTLTFEKSGPVDVEMVVAPVGAPGPEGAAMKMGGAGHGTEAGGGTN